MQQIFWTYLQRAIVQAVGQTKGAIGYIGLAYETKEVKQLAFLMIKENIYWAICSESAKDKTYPIARPLFYMFDKKNAAKVKTLLIMHFLLKGKKLLEKWGIFRWTNKG
jgi:phosphate transport system substrate-binding protein